MVPRRGATPGGTLEILVRADEGTARGVVTVGPGQATSLTVVLAPRAPRSP
jgi:hypothetical protein